MEFLLRTCSYKPVRLAVKELEEVKNKYPETCNS
jgi:hypothetical protein